jgi:sec-independent protein translocase protein TatA
MNASFALFDLGGGQILLILALILIFFGARKIPELARGLGQGIKEFKKATREVTDEINNAAEEPPQKRIAPPSAPTQAQTSSATPVASTNGNSGTAQS